MGKIKTFCIALLSLIMLAGFLRVWFSDARNARFEIDQIFKGLLSSKEVNVEISEVENDKITKVSKIDEPYEWVAFLGQDMTTLVNKCDAQNIKKEPFCKRITIENQTSGCNFDFCKNDSTIVRYRGLKSDDGRERCFYLKPQDSKRLESILSFKDKGKIKGHSGF